MRKSPSSKGEGRKAVSVQETEQNEGETKKKKKAVLDPGNLHHPRRGEQGTKP